MAVTGPPPKDYDFTTREIGDSCSPLGSALIYGMPNLILQEQGYCMNRSFRSGNRSMQSVKWLGSLRLPSESRRRGSASTSGVFEASNDSAVQGLIHTPTKPGIPLGWRQWLWLVALQIKDHWLGLTPAGPPRQSSNHFQSARAFYCSSNGHSRAIAVRPR